MMALRIPKLYMAETSSSRAPTSVSAHSPIHRLNPFVLLRVLPLPLPLL